jgi:hypothetical protein
MAYRYSESYSPLSLRDAYRDVGGRAKQDARAERVGERESKRPNNLNLYPLILSFSRGTQKAGIKEKRRIVIGLEQVL